MENSPMPQEPTSKMSTPRQSLRVDLRVIIGLLLVIIVGMLIAWQPWQTAPGADARTVQVTGTTTVKSEPDQFVFYPYYTFTNADKDTALKTANQKSNDLVGQLKKLGITDSQLKTSVNGNDNIYYAPATDPKTQGSKDYRYTLSITITVPSRDVAQKVQDFLVGTSPDGAVTPQASFSEAKRKQLESQARDEATKDARAKADQSAHNLGFKVGKVKDVKDGQGFNTMPYASSEIAPTAAGSDSKAVASPSVQPGQNDLSYSVTVTYYLR